MEGAGEVAVEDVAGDFVDDLHGGGDGGGVGGVGLDEEGGFLTANETLGEIGRDADDKLHVATGEQAAAFLLGLHVPGDAK